MIKLDKRLLSFVVRVDSCIRLPESESNMESSTKTHISERGLSDDLIDIHIDNNGNISDLETEIEKKFIFLKELN